LSSRRKFTSAGAARPEASSSPKTHDEAREAATKILGMDIKGLTVEEVLVEAAADIKEEYYIGTHDRPRGSALTRDGFGSGRHRHEESRGH
jgi:hypothetical protein